MPASGKQTAGFYWGRHFSAGTDEVKALKRPGQLDEATELQWHLVAATENDAQVNGWGAPRGTTSSWRSSPASGGDLTLRWPS